MLGKIAVRSFFQVSLSHPLDELALSQIGSSLSSQLCFARKLNTLHEQQNVDKKHQIFLEKIKKMSQCKHGNMVFQLLENSPEKFMLTTNLHEKL